MLAILLLLSLAIVFLISKNSSSQNNGSFNNVQSFLSCAKEEETIGAPGMPNSCCSGLKPVGGWPGGYSGDCALPPPPTGLSICTNCGDGLCNAYNGENKCNCQKDCTGENVVNCVGFHQDINEEKESCCPPLKPIKPYLYKLKEGKDCFIVPENIATNSITLCELCGNGTCAHFENKCNCPEDCK